MSDYAGINAASTALARASAAAKAGKAALVADISRGFEVAAASEVLATIPVPTRSWVSAEVDSSPNPCAFLSSYTQPVSPEALIVVDAGKASLIFRAKCSRPDGDVTAWRSQTESIEAGAFISWAEKYPSNVGVFKKALNAATADLEAFVAVAAEGTKTAK